MVVNRTQTGFNMWRRNRGLDWFDNHNKPENPIEEEKPTDPMPETPTTEDNGGLLDAIGDVVDDILPDIDLNIGIGIGKKT